MESHSRQNGGLERLLSDLDVERHELMAALGVSENTVRRWQQGQGMSVARLEELADWLSERAGRRISTDEVLGRTKAAA